MSFIAVPSVRYGKIHPRGTAVPSVRYERYPTSDIVSISTISYSDYENDWFQRVKQVWNDNIDEEHEEMLAIAESIVENMKEPCRTILSYFYYMEYSMTIIAEKMGLKNSDTAKTTKNRCMSKFKETTSKQLKERGLI